MQRFAADGVLDVLYYERATFLAVVPLQKNQMVGRKLLRAECVFPKNKINLQRIGPCVH